MIKCVLMEYISDVGHPIPGRSGVFCRTWCKRGMGLGTPVLGTLTAVTAARSRDLASSFPWCLQARLFGQSPLQLGTVSWMYGYSVPFPLNLFLEVTVVKRRRPPRNTTSNPG